MAEDVEPQVNTEGLFNTKEGPLAKTGSNNKGWKDRYFRLKDGRLGYYRSEKDSSELGYVDLRDCTQVIKATGKKGGYGFDVHVPGRVYNMSAKTEQERDDWIAVLDVSVAIAKSVYGETQDRRSGSILSRARRRSGSIDPDELSLDNQSNRRSEPDFNSLLEAEVKALNSKSTQLEVELQTALSQRDQYQAQVQEMKNDHEDTVRQLKEEVSLLKNKIESLEKAKSSLEAINDSLRVQVQEKDESMMNLEQQMTEEIKELEDEARTLQDDLERLKEKQIEVNEQNEALTQLHSDLQLKLRNIASDADEERQEMTQKNAILSQKVEELAKQIETEREKYDQEKAQRQKAEDQLQQTTELYHRLEVTERERDRLKLLMATVQQNQQADSTSTIEELKSERLQLQVELENLRSTMNKEIELVKVEGEKGKNEQMKILEEEYQNKLTQTIESKDSELMEMESLMTKLKEDLSMVQDNNNLLQIEKEKALADLIAMKKNMKGREKRSLSEEESTSPVFNGNGGGSPLKDSKLSEAENRAEMATRLLKEIQAERDLLKAQIKKIGGSPSKPSLTDTLPVGANSGGASGNSSHSVQRLLPGAGSSTAAAINTTGFPSDFKTKTQPSVAMSTTRDLPPPKPKPPAKHILDQLFL